MPGDYLQKKLHFRGEEKSQNYTSDLDFLWYKSPSKHFFLIDSSHKTTFSDLILIAMFLGKLQMFMP